MIQSSKIHFVLGVQKFWIPDFFQESERPIATYLQLRTKSNDYYRTFNLLSQNFSNTFALASLMLCAACPPEELSDDYHLHHSNPAHQDRAHPSSLQLLDASCLIWSASLEVQQARWKYARHPPRVAVREARPTP